MISIDLEVLNENESISFIPERLIVAGYTGRNQAAVQEHIDELAAIGIAPPPRVPMRYELETNLLTADQRVEGASNDSSGEVEPVLLRHRGQWYLGVGSDHTDRVIERSGIAESKAACPKPLGMQVVRLPGGVTEGSIDELWDQATVQSSVDGALYQSGKLSSLRTPSDLLQRIGESDNADDIAVFTGTVPVLGGEFKFGRQWSLTLKFDNYNLQHTYTQN